MRDSLLPDSPRVKTDPGRKAVNGVGAFVGSGLKGARRGVAVPVGLTLLREELRNRKLLGFWAWPGGGDVFGEDGTSDTDIRVIVPHDVRRRYLDSSKQGCHVPVLLLERCRSAEGDTELICSAL